MRFIAFIEYQDVIERILNHPGLWEVEPGPPKRQIAAFVNRAPYRLFPPGCRPLWAGGGHAGLVFR